MTLPSVFRTRLTHLTAFFRSTGQRAMSSTTVQKTMNGDRSNLIPLSSRLREGRALALDVWSIYNAANLPADCINLGQGYMNFPPPKWVTDAADEALKTTPANHYSHPKGRIRLRQAIKNFYEASFNRSLDIETEILVTSGANEGQYSVFTAFLEQGDEVIMFEPFFDQYLPSVTFNGGKPVYVPLHPHTEGDNPTSNDWKIDFDELRRAITPRAKMIILNTPHNPVGKVFRKDELEQLAAIAEEFNLLVMADEVYDCLVYDGQEHIRIANLPGMWDRTVTVFSAGKAFAATGWRIGWLVGPPSIIQPTLAATTRIVFCTNSPLQEAAAAGLEEAQERGFFAVQNQEYQDRRDVLLRAFDQIGLKYTQPEGSYFILLVHRFQKMLRLPTLTHWCRMYPEFNFQKIILSRRVSTDEVVTSTNEIGVSSIPVSEVGGVSI
ncbi:PLP-dependent transferase [Hygrophoropsis aurantiaca]|uniref:PLP-dependent transferase n=1 Tax=Hygrophoropsis aurantiaca TaxID=72124 RepID=A0ACB8ASW9_9AGAM|nr:PLP-dependent transferase [Hygrophoropsis aurantiaca]